jgi:UPF0288 family protein (methanogenesis marker protein 3)
MRRGKRGHFALLQIMKFEQDTDQQKTLVDENVPTEMVKRALVEACRESANKPQFRRIIRLLEEAAGGPERFKQLLVELATGSTGC